jgi:hypothetical protein
MISKYVCLLLLVLASMFNASAQVSADKWKINADGTISPRAGRVVKADINVVAALPALCTPGQMVALVVDGLANMRVCSPPPNYLYATLPAIWAQVPVLEMSEYALSFPAPTITVNAHQTTNAATTASLFVRQVNQPDAPVLTNVCPSNCTTTYTVIWVGYSGGTNPLTGEGDSVIGAAATVLNAPTLDATHTIRVAYPADGTNCSYYRLHKARNAGANTQGWETNAGLNPIWDHFDCHDRQVIFDTAYTLGPLLTEGSFATPGPAVDLPAATNTTGEVIADGIRVFANNAAAIAGGLAYGQFYRTGDALMIVH